MMAEFFVLRKFRRRGIGRLAAHQLFARYPGLWRVYQEAGNLPAQSFWREVVSRYTHNQFEYVDEKHWDGIILEFDVKESER